MTCAELELLLCDYVDGTLHGEQKTAVESHLSGCASCAELARDSASVVAFIQRAEVVEPPAELLTRILFDVSDGKAKVATRQSGFKKFFGRWLEPVLQPRVAMGMAMTVLSFAMLGRFSGIQVRQLRPSDLDPVKIWASLDDRVHRSWERAVKYYDSLKLVFEVQSRLKEWSDQADADRSAGAPNQTQGSGAPRNPDQNPAAGKEKK